MITFGTEYSIYLFLVLLAIAVATIIIPCYGYLRKGWKGCGLGCILQPVIAIILCGVVGGISYSRQLKIIDKNRDAAMVSVRTTAVEDSDTVVRTWYLKPDEECMCEIRPIAMDSDDYDDIEFFDVVATDSGTLCVEDHIEVSFDLAARRVTATDFGKPIDIAHVNWENIDTYYTGRQQ